MCCLPLSISWSYYFWYFGAISSGISTDVEMQCCPSNYTRFLFIELAGDGVKIKNVSYAKVVAKIV